MCPSMPEGARLCDDVDLSATELAILGIEVARENSKLSDGVEIRNNRRAYVYVFFHVASVDDDNKG
jgi:hypothetical protein